MMIDRKTRTPMTLALGLGLALPALAQEWLPQKEDLPAKKAEYSPYVDQHFPNRVLWGDTHVHTILSMDDGFLGTTLGPEEAFRFARGEEMVSNTGQRVKLNRPLDFLAVTDHAEYLGIADLILKSDPDLLATKNGRRWHDMVKAGGDEALKAVWEVTIVSIKGEDLLKNDKIKRSVWERVIAAASKYYEPGRFTTFNGFEWTSFPGFNNLHRCVLFRDGLERVKQVLPFSTLDSSDPEDLWKYMASYEEKTGGQVLAIPHNGNMSNGRMFEGQSFLGKALTRAYAEERMRREPLLEVTQTKGDGEMHPFLSTDDDFANFERWDFGNFGNPSVPKTKEMLQTEYARSALKLGLQWDEKLGANPFKFGMLGSTDSHTSLSTSSEDNFFGKLPQDEPSPDRWKHAFVFGEGKKPLAGGAMEQAAGLAAVWSRENTREAIFDSMMRKEVYATTGSRIIVRVFGGWDFAADEIERPDFAAQGYARGVPMGGDLSEAPAGECPAFMVRALRDPDGAKLDRIQIIKGWLDGKDELHERIFDVAVSDGRQIGADGRCTTPVGNTVDVPNATYKNTIGDALLMAYWKDPEFDSKQRAFYYVRVIEIPTPRWTAYDQKRFGIKMPDDIPMTVTERAYTSPIWYAP
jgi:Protein of unknown function (DUF3604)